MSKDNGDTPPAKPVTPPSGSEQVDTPPKPSGEQTPPKKEGDPAPQPTNADIMSEMKKLGGRVTKVEQRSSSSKQPPKVAAEKKEFTFEPPEPVSEPNAEVQRVQQDQELVDLERSITPLLRDEKYKDLFEKDTTLLEILTGNPVALLKEPPADAPDALAKITEILDKKAETLSKAKAKADDKDDKTPPAPQAGPANSTDNPPEPKKPDSPAQPKLKSADEVAKGLTDKIAGDGRLRGGIKQPEK